MRAVTILILLMGPTIGYGQQTKSQARKWISDIEYLKEQLIERHADIYHKISQDEFDQLFENLISETPKLTTEQLLIRIAQVVAKIGDGHTSFFPGDQRGKWFHLFPMKFWAFSDGMYVISTTAEHRQFLGKKLLKIGSVPIDEVDRRIRTTISADNEMEYIYSIPFAIAYAETLQVLDIIESSEYANFTFENGTASIKSMTLKEWQYADYFVANSIYPDGKSRTQRVDDLFASDLTKDSIGYLGRRMFYWYTYLPEPNAIFLQYNVCWDQKERPRFKRMMQNMFEELDRKGAQRFVIDLRQNSGGEPIIAQPLMDQLKARPEYLNEGRVFVLVGRRTYSAALTNALQLRKLGVRTVGEPSRGKPNHPSEGRDIKLRRNRLWVTVSTQQVNRDIELGDAEFIPIELPVEIKIEDFIAGKDTALKMALNAELLKSKE